MPQKIFCPQCDALILNEEICPNCGWRRTAASSTGENILWQKTLEEKFGQPYSVFAATDDFLVIAAQDVAGYAEVTGTIIALAASSGEEKWRYRLENGRVTRILTRVGDTVLVGSQDMRPIAEADNELLALDMASGEISWTFAAKAHSLSAPAVLEDTLFFTTNDNRAYGVHIHNGDLKWQIEGLPPWSPEPPVAGDDHFFIGSQANVLTGIDAQNGAQQVIYEGETNFSVKPAYHEGTLFACGWDRYLYAVDVRSRSLIWRASTIRGASSPPIAGTHLYLGVKDVEDGSPAYALYAFDRQTGARVWRFQTTKHVQAPPFISGDFIIIGDRSGGLTVLDKANGDLRWSVELSTAAASQPVVNEDALYIGTKEGEILAFDCAAFSTPDLSSAESYREQGEWELAGSIAALQGDFAGAAKDYEQLDHPYHAALLYERAEMWAEAAEAYMQAGMPAKGVDSYQKAGNKQGEAEALVAGGQFREAAVIYAELGLFAEAAACFEKAATLDEAAKCYVAAGDRHKAAEIYLNLDQPQNAAQLFVESGEIDQAVTIYRDANLLIEAAKALLANERKAEAAALYEEAGELGEAASLWEQLEDIDAASRVYRQMEDAGALARLGSWRLAAELYLAKEPPMLAEAAACYEKMEAWEEAAALYERAGDGEKAAVRWLSAGEAEMARELLEELEPSESIARLLEQTGDLGGAAEMWAQLGNMDEAIALFRQAGLLEKALPFLEEKKAWPQLRALAQELNAYELEAKACLELAREESWDKRISLYNCAAKAMVKAAKTYEGRKSAPAAVIADLYDKASEYFDQSLDSDNAAAYRQEVRRLLRLPRINLDYQPDDGSLVAGKWSELVIHMANVGFGPARLISLRVAGDMFSGDAEKTQNLQGLLPGKRYPIALRIRPRADAVGDAVPLDFELSYLLPNGEEFVRHIRGKVKVHADRPSGQPVRGRYAEWRDDSVTIDPDTANKLHELGKKIRDHFNTEELKDLCLLLGIRYDFLEGSSLPVKVWSLVEYCQRHNRLAELRRTCAELRPHVSF